MSRGRYYFQGRDMGHSGFTLVEVLMSLVLGGMIITVAAGFMFGIFHLTLSAEKKPLFAEHVGNSSRFLEFALATALPPQSSENTEEGGEAEALSVEWKRVPGAAGLNPMALSFRSNGELPIFQGEMYPIPSLQVYLVADEDDGLSLLWQSDAMANENQDRLMQSKVSPYVGSLTYLYYDAEAKRWNASDEPEKNMQGQLVLPDFIELDYLHPDGREMTRRIFIASDG